MTSRIFLFCLAAIWALSSGAGAQQAQSPKPQPLQKSAAQRAAKPTGTHQPTAEALRLNPAVPQPELLLLMIRTALVALDQANKTNNYTVLREIGGPSLQKFVSAQLGEVFADLRAQKIDLSPTVVVTPQMFAAPTILSNGMLRLTGYFPTQPRQINFDLLFERINSDWMLAGLRVSAVQSNAQTTLPNEPPPAKKIQ